MERKQVIPHKHYSAHAGRTYLIGNAILPTDGGGIIYVGTIFRVPKGRIDAPPDNFVATPDGYLKWDNAMIACNMIINQWDGLGECFREDAGFKIK